MSSRLERRASVCLAALMLFAGLGHAAPAAPPQATTFQITPDHAGVTTSGGMLALQTQPLWSVQLPGALSYPLIADSGVYVTSAGIPGGNGNGGSQLYALDAKTGKTLWAPVTLPATYTASYLAYDAGTVFALTSDGVLSSYNAATGVAGWSEQLPGQYAFSSPPTASKGILYVGGAGSGGTLYAIDESSGALVWTNGVENGDSSSPAVSAQGVYVSYPCQVYDFDPASGAMLWHYNGGCEGGGGRTPVLAGGKLYVRDPPTDTVFDAADGSTLGSFTSAFAPAVTATTAFTLTGDGALNWIDLQSGATKFSFTGDGSLVTPPIVIDQQVVVGSSSGNLYALDTSSAVLQWQVKAPSGILPAGDSQNTIFFTGLAAANGILVVPAGTTLVAYSLVGPPAPTGLSATSGVGAVALSWTASPGATAYNVYMGSGPGREDVVPVATGVPGPSFEVTTGVTPGTVYYFTVKRADATGLSAPSNEASGSMTAPAAPTGLAAKPGSGSVTLSWAATSGATSYSIYQSTTPGGEGTAAVQTVTATQATILGLTPGARYYFTVTALAHSIAGPVSGEVSAVAGIDAPDLAVMNGHLEVLLTWNAVTGAASYNVYSGTSAGGESATPVASGVTATEFVVGNLNAATTYYFVVRAVAGSTSSGPSNEVSIRPDSGNGGGSGGGGAADPLTLLVIAALVARMSWSRLESRSRVGGSISPLATI